MKRIILCSVLAGIMIAGGIFSCFYVFSFSERMGENIENISRCFEAGESEAARQAFDTADREWKSFRRLHILIADDDHALEITMSMAKIDSLLQQEDEEVLTECESAKELIRVYGYEQLPYVMNIL